MDNKNIISNTDKDTDTDTDKDTDMLNLTNKSWEIFPQYVNVINEYLLIFTNSKKFKKGEKDSIYLLKNGFTTLTYVFKTIMTLCWKFHSYFYKMEWPLRFSGFVLFCLSIACDRSCQL